MQSHGGQVRKNAEFCYSCGDFGESSASNRYARRSLLRAAVFGGGGGNGETGTDPPVLRPASDATIVTGVVADVSPDVLILHTTSGDVRLTLTPGTRAWRGSAVSPAALRRGDQAIVRRARERASAERVWARIGRVTGTIIERQGSELLVDEGPARQREVVLIGKNSLRPIQVRFPRMEPGYLIDVIGLRQERYLLGLTPATAQPPYRADHPPTPPLVNGHVPERISGTAVWHEPGEEPLGLVGVAYPALDPETNCGHAAPHGREPYLADPHTASPGCVRLPYLSVGSMVRIRNECTDREEVLPVTSCGASARLFCDRCVECGTSPRGRLADLTVTAFAGLGGNLEDGCFNATLAMAG